MENKILSLSHNDLDGISCQLAIFEKYKKNINFFNTSYNDIEKKLKILEDVITINFKKIFITDLYFKKNNFQQLEKIIKLNPNIKFIYIDHHEYEESEKEIIKKLKKYSNFIFIHSLKVSASKLTFLALKLKNLDLKKLIELVDIYDLWKENNRLFMMADARLNDATNEIDKNIQEFSDDKFKHFVNIVIEEILERNKKRNIRKL